MPTNLIYSVVYPVQDSHFKLKGESGSYQIHHTSTDWILSVNDIAATIWQLCSHEYTVEDIIDVLADIYGQPVKSMTDDVVSILNQFSEQHVIRLYVDQYPAGKVVDSGVTYHTIPQHLHDLLEDLRPLVKEFFPGRAKGSAPSLDQELLQSVMKGGAARAIDGKHLDLKLINNDEINNLIQDIGKELDVVFKPLDVPRNNSGHMLYGGNSWMGWHTNEDFPGRRIYCNWSERDGENDFRYLDADSGEMIIKPEPAGWSMKSFYIPTPPQQLWHSINAGGKRIALGFAEFRYKRIESLVSKKAA